METSKAGLSSTPLKGRVLWYDGDSTVKTDDLLQIIKTSQPCTNIFVDSITDEIKQYNLTVPLGQQFKIKVQLKELRRDWNISDEYKNIDITNHVAQLLESERINNQWELVNEEYIKRHHRINVELTLYRNKGLLGVLKALIYIINTLERVGAVWGVGRGSSVSSYVLYLLKVHDVDSVLYELDISDFLRD